MRKNTWKHGQMADVGLKCAYCRARRVRVAALAVGFYANNESSFLWCRLHVGGSQVYDFIRPPSGR